MLKIQFLSDINYLHVLVAGVAYWVLGALWYMAIFQKPWAAGVEKWGIKMGEKPDNSVMMRKMILSFLSNLGAAVMMAWLVNNQMGYSASVGAKVGFGAGLLAVCVFAVGDTWLSKPRSTFLIDASYHIAGLTVCGLIIGGWQ